MFKKLKRCKEFDLFMQLLMKSLTWTKEFDSFGFNNEGIIHEVTKYKMALASLFVENKNYLKAAKIYD